MKRAGRLKRVNAVIVNGGEAQENEAVMALEGDVAYNLVTGENVQLHSYLRLSMAGIGHPSSFLPH